MPELPEVNASQRYFDATSLHQKIIRVAVSDDHIIRDLDGAAFRQKLEGQTFEQSYRQGKYLFGDLTNGHSVLLHFGMTGRLHYYSEPEDQPKHERFHFAFANGFRLGFNCPRKFARIRYLEDRNAFIREKKLGEDAQRIARKDFLELMDGKTGSIKGFLLKQEYLAGVGNLYADEICYRTKIHPASTVDKLDADQRQHIYEAMQDILDFAVSKNATYSEYPDDWLWHHRDEEDQSPDGSGAIEKAKIAGRTSYFVPGRQILYD